MSYTLYTLYKIERFGILSKSNGHGPEAEPIEPAYAPLETPRLATCQIGEITGHFGQVLDEMQNGTVFRIVDRRKSVVRGYLTITPPQEIVPILANESREVPERKRLRGLHGRYVAFK